MFNHFFSSASSVSMLLLVLAFRFLKRPGLKSRGAVGDGEALGFAKAFFGCYILLPYLRTLVRGALNSRVAFGLLAAVVVGGASWFEKRPRLKSRVAVGEREALR